jgi:hypothetical protein
MGKYFWASNLDLRPKSALKAVTNIEGFLWKVRSMDAGKVSPPRYFILISFNMMINIEKR